MPVSSKTVIDRADKIVGAWKEQATGKTINTYTLEAYGVLKEAVSDAEAKVTEAEASLTGYRNKLTAALEALNSASNDVVEGVRGSKDLGGRNGSLYEAMGYVRTDERKSGLTRKKTASASATTK